MARLDRAAPMREVAQIAACVGRQFSRDVIAAVSPLDASALDNALRQLIDAGLVFHTGTVGGYTFKHALVQDAAYNSLLKTKRQAIHSRITETLLSQFPDVAASAPETLAYHYTEAADFEKAAHFWRLAAERASARFANAEAIAHARKGLAALSRVLSGDDRVDKELTLRMALVASLRMADRYDEALEELMHAEALATEHQRLLALARIHYLRGNIYFPLGQVDRCLAEHTAALQFAQRSASTEDEARALGGIGDAHYMGGRMLKAHEHFDRCITLCRTHSLEAIEIAYLPMRATTHMYCLRFGLALDDCRSVCDFVARAGQLRGEIISRNISSQILLDQHEFALAEEHARRALELVGKIGARRFVPLFNDVLARVRLHAGDRAGAIQLLQESWAAARETSTTFTGPWVLGALALASIDPGGRREALCEGQALLNRGCVAHNYFWFYRDAIEVSLVEAEWEAADAYARALKDYFSTEPMPWADFTIARGQALAELGRRGRCDSVVMQLGRLRDEATRLGMRTELAQLEAALESV
jgi:tetratricopeptide (TPR) repeat protein